MAHVNMYATLGHGLGTLPPPSGTAPTNLCLDASGNIVDCTSSAAAYHATNTGPVCLDSTGTITDCAGPDVAYNFSAPGTSSGSTFSSLFGGLSTTTLAIGGVAVFAFLMLLMGGRR